MLLVAVEGCTAHQDRFPVIQETWADHQGPWHLQFFTGPRLGVADDYLSLPQKTKAICVWSLQHGFDHTLIVDTDTYISMPRFVASGFEKHSYVGFVQTWLKYPYCSGPSYCIDKPACEALALADWRHYEVEGHATDEDVMVGSVLYQRGFRYHHDDRYVNAAGVLPDNDVISYHLSFHSPYSHDRMRECHRKANDRDA